MRDLRLHWPDAERRLKREGELVVTRDGEPVARLIAYRAAAVTRPTWSPQQHLKWLSRTWKRESEGSSTDEPSTDELLTRDRDE